MPDVIPCMLVKPADIFRVYEHLVSDRNSHILKHLKSSAPCKSLVNEDCFVILDRANSVYQLKLKGLYILNVKNLI